MDTTNKKGAPATATPSTPRLDYSKLDTKLFCFQLALSALARRFSL
ncbi:MAG: hypothetical protein ABIR84_09255 [Candidatus Nitrotoga sp.]